MEFVYSWGDWKTRLEKSVELAKELKSKYLIVHSWDYTDPKYVSWIIKNQQTVMNLAKPVKVVFENATCRFDKITKEQINPAYHFDIMKQFESINLDTSHIATAEMDILEYYEKVKDKVNHIHFSDSDMAVDPKSPWKIADAHMIPGTGKLPLKKLLKNLKADKFKGPISLELWYENYGKNITDEVVIKNLKAAKKFVETNFK
jgi:protein FrlC